MNQIERRIDALEQRSGGQSGFVKYLNANDAAFFNAIMRRQAASGRDFETFLRTMEQADLERLLQIHIDGLAAAGIGLEDLEGLDAG